MGSNLQAPRGTKDLFGPEFERLEALERLCASTARLWGYAGIRTPIFEETGLFVRSIGEATDIVEKEMFTIPPRTEKGDDKSYTLRPENTAGVVRAYLEHNLHKTQGLAKFFYLGPQFRRERPQAGRLREFNQFGAEVLGLEKGLSREKIAPLTAYVDVMLLALDILSRAGLKKIVVRYNSVGCNRPGCRDGYREKLKAELSAHKEKLCGDCQRRLDRNIFRVLDCKKPNCREICALVLQEINYSGPRFRQQITARQGELCKDCLGKLRTSPPTPVSALKIVRACANAATKCEGVIAKIIAEFLPPFCEECGRQVGFMQHYVEQLFLKGLWPREFEGFKADSTLVRGLDYYTGLVFEFNASGLGAQDAVGGGGSYDGLIAEMGGPPLGATGFALGLERVLMAQKADGTTALAIPEVGPIIYLATAALEGEAQLAAYGLAVELRRAGLACEFDLAGRSLKAQFKQADKLGAGLTIIVGEDEQKADEATLRNMTTGEQRRVKSAEAVAEIKKALGRGGA